MIENEDDLADVYFLVGSELASPLMVSRDTFQHGIVPFAKELISMIHSYGKEVSLEIGYLFH